MEFLTAENPQSLIYENITISFPCDSLIKEYTHQ